MNNKVAIKWTQQETLKLLYLYRKHSLLYDCRNKFYRINSARESAYSKIQNEMMSLRPSVSILQIVRKIKNLRHIYKKHHADPKSSRKESLWYLDHMKFLQPFIMKDKVQPNIGPPRLTKEETDTDDMVDLVSESEYEDTSNGPIMIKTEVVDSTEVEVEPDINTNSSLNENNYQLPHEHFSRKKRRNSEYYDENYEESSFPKRGKVENFAEEQTTAESLSEGTGRDEELFCNFLCQNLKKIRSNDEYEDVQWKILDLVKLAIRKEKILQAYSQSGNSNGPSQFTYHYN